MNLPSRKEIIRKVKSKGKRVACVLPVHYPPELLRAFSIHPIELWGPPGIDTTTAKAHLQSYICSIMHSSLSFILKGCPDEIDFILVPHCCDSLQGIGSILKDFITPKQKILTLYIPRGKRESDIEFLAEELKRIYGMLSEITGLEPKADILHSQIDLQERIDELLLSVYEKHSKKESDSVTFYRTIRAKGYLPPDEYINLLEKLIESKARENRVRILLSGIVPEPEEVLQVVEDAGGVVICDDMACCYRRVYKRVSDGDPFKRMARRMLSVPDSLLGSPIGERFDFLVKLCNTYGANGIIFYNIKFCEPEKFYHPLLKERLKSANIESLIIETDINEKLPQQIRTRIHAFIEKLRRD